VYYFGLDAGDTMEASEKVERLLTDIRVKADQLIVDDEEARNAGVSDGSLPSLDSDEGLEKQDTTQTEAWKKVKAQAWLEFEKTVLEQQKKYFQTLLRQSVINKWIDLREPWDEGWSGLWSVAIHNRGSRRSRSHPCTQAVSQ
jgi:hypothetical protein